MYHNTHHNKFIIFSFHCKGFGHRSCYFSHFNLLIMMKCTRNKLKFIEQIGMQVVFSKIPFNDIRRHFTSFPKFEQ